MAKNKKNVEKVASTFGGLLKKAVGGLKKNKNSTAKGLCESRGLGYDPSTGKCK